MRRVGPLPEPSKVTEVPRLWNSRGLGARLGVSEGWVRVWHKHGNLRGQVLHARPGDRGRLVFTDEAVIEFLEARGIQCQASKGDAA